MRKKKMRGQSLIELIFAIGIIVLVLSGLVVLLVKSMGAKTKGFDRKKAVELGEKVVEELIEDKINDPNTFWSGNFWTVNNGVTKTMTGYNNFYYVVYGAQSTAGGCSVARLECVNVAVSIGWSGIITGQEIELNRFFSRK